MKKIYTDFGLISIESNTISILNSIDTFKICKNDNNYNIVTKNKKNYCSGLYYDKDIIKNNKILLLNQSIKIFRINNKYLNYISYMKNKNLAELFEKAYLQNLIEDIYKDIKSNLFGKLLNYCKINAEKIHYIENDTIDLVNYFDNLQLNIIFYGIEKLLIQDLKNIFLHLA